MNNLPTFQKNKKYNKPLIQNEISRYPHIHTHNSNKGLFVFKFN